MTPEAYESVGAELHKNVGAGPPEMVNVMYRMSRMCKAQVYI